nr:ribosomal L7Ae/L30e/S12e/Gadd45 family protein [uncultured Solibaculum sp.]
MNDRLLSLLGIARRAGKLTMGFDPVAEDAAKHKARLVLTASDLSQRTLKGVGEICTQHNIPCIPLGRTMEEIHKAVGKRTGVLATADHGFAQSIKELCRFNNEEESQ